MITGSAEESLRAVIVLHIRSVMWTMRAGENGLGRLTRGASHTLRVETCVTVTMIACLGICVPMKVH